MLRLRHDDSFELRLVEEAVVSLAPPRLSDERREALRTRIMSTLGPQDAAPQRRLGVVANERWVLVPAGVGVIAAILAAAIAADHQPETTQPGGAEQSVQRSSPRPDEPVEYVAAADKWLAFEGGIAVGVERDSRVSYSGDPDGRVFRFLAGRATVATSENSLLVRCDAFQALLAANSIAAFETRGATTYVTALLGDVDLLLADGATAQLELGKTYEFPSAAPGIGERQPSSEEPATNNQPADTSSAGAPQLPPQPARPESAAPGASSGSGDAATPSSAPNPPGATAQTDDEDAPATPSAPAIPSSTTGENTSPNAGGNGNPPANSNAGGNTPGTSNAGGNGNPPANSNAGGNSPGTSNAGGNGNPPANSNAGGNSPGASNAGGNGNPPSNSNAGGNGAAKSNPGGKKTP